MAGFVYNTKAPRRTNALTNDSQTILTENK